jgi:hypothetical protein
MKISGAAVVSIACIPVAGAFVARSRLSSGVHSISLNLHHDDNHSSIDTHRNEWLGPLAAVVTGLTIASQAAMADQPFNPVSNPSVVEATSGVLQGGKN